MTGENWYENDSYWERWGPILFSRQAFARATVEIDQILKLTGLGSGGRVLDIPCGPGRHSLELARRGFHVTGVDRSTAYLKQAAESAETEGLEIEFVRQDMREFLRPDGFDAAVHLGGSFGYFDDPEDDVKLVKNISSSLRPGGILVLDTVGKERIAAAFREREWGEADGVFLLQERKLIGDWEGIESRWITFRDNKMYEATTRVRLYSACELKTLLRSCGFENVKAYGSFEGTPYDTAARRLEVVAYKGQ